MDEDIKQMAAMREPRTNSPEVAAMTDIVERLAQFDGNPLCLEAANEIERLRVFEAIFVKHRAAYSSGCACDISEDDDDGSVAFAENGCRIVKWCGLHKWYMDQRAADSASGGSMAEQVRRMNASIERFRAEDSATTREDVNRE